MIGGMAIRLARCTTWCRNANDLVYTVATGNRHGVSETDPRPTAFRNSPARVCPALCEAACTCNVNGAPVSAKEDERAIIEYRLCGRGWVKPDAADKCTGPAGRGRSCREPDPSGLAAADASLNRRGHQVTVFERSDRVGGLLMYGIPNMKLDKACHRTPY